VRLSNDAEARFWSSYRAGSSVCRMPRQSGRVVSVATSPRHEFSKTCSDTITLLAGVGVVGDAHAGATIQHRSRVAKDPSQPNLRQVHLIHRELLDELTAAGFRVAPGALGENVTTTGVSLLDLPVGSVLSIGDDVILGVTGLRNPCWQIDTYEKGLLAAVLDHDEQGRLIRKAGIMAVVQRGGEIAIGDEIRVALPPPPHRPLDRV
jgi:MOSC domain-containing protein YiiM